eukprot:g20553.t1
MPFLRDLERHESNGSEPPQLQVSDERSILVRVGSGHQWRKYIFDACLPEDRAQKQVFQDSGVSYLLDEALAGYSATVLAYGQTGSGKTYTMMGRSVSSERSSPDEFSKKSDDGLILRAARRLFRQMGEMSNMRVSVTASFAEIFNAPGAVNECICDLLNPEAGHLQVRFSQKHGFFISDLAVMECGTITDVRSVLEAGMQNRRVSAHALNRESSRTHALFTLHLDCEKFEEDGSSTRTYGKVTFVDLAGSERLKAIVPGRSWGKDYLRPTDVVEKFLASGRSRSCELPSVDASKLSWEDFEDLAEQHGTGLVLKNLNWLNLEEWRKDRLLARFGQRGVGGVVHGAGFA